MLHNIAIFMPQCSISKVFPSYIPPQPRIIVPHDVVVQPLPLREVLDGVLVLPRGAPVFMTDRDARVVWTAMYRPYGEAYVDDDPDGDGTLVTSNLRYPGQYEDTIEDFPEGERLYYNVMRYYDPGAGEVYDC